MNAPSPPPLLNNSGNLSNTGTETFQNSLPPPPLPPSNKSDETLVIPPPPPSLTPLPKSQIPHFLPVNPPPGLPHTTQSGPKKRKKWGDPLAAQKKMILNLNDPSLDPIPFENFRDIDWDSVNSCKLSESGSSGVLFVKVDYYISSNHRKSGIVVIKASSSIAADIFANKIAIELGIPGPKFDFIAYLGDSWGPIALNCLKQVVKQTHGSESLSQCMTKSKYNFTKLSQHAPSAARIFNSPFFMVIEWIPSMTIPDAARFQLKNPKSPLLSNSLTNCVPGSECEKNLQTLGSILYLDLFLNNWDRFPISSIWQHDGNFGNILLDIRKYRIYAIDNSTTATSDSEYISKVSAKINKTIEITGGDPDSLNISPLIQEYTSVICGMSGQFLNSTPQVQQAIQSGFVRAWRISCTTFTPDFLSKILDSTTKLFSHFFKVFSDIMTPSSVGLNSISLNLLTLILNNVAVESKSTTNSPPVPLVPSLTPPPPCAIPSLNLNSKKRGKSPRKKYGGHPSVKYLTLILDYQKACISNFITPNKSLPLRHSDSVFALQISPTIAKYVISFISLLFKFWVSIDTPLPKYLILPEGISSHFDSKSHSTDWIDPWKLFCKRWQVYAVCGSNRVKESDGTEFQQSVIISDEGTLIGKYNKRNLMFVEQETTAKGTDSFVFETPTTPETPTNTLLRGNGVLICHDIEQDTLIQDTIKTLSGQGNAGNTSQSIIFNPVHLIGSQLTSRSIVFSNWYSSLSASHSRYLSRVLEYNFALVRIDRPLARELPTAHSPRSKTGNSIIPPGKGLGNSLFISPQCSFTSSSPFSSWNVWPLSNQSPHSLKSSPGFRYIVAFVDYSPFEISQQDGFVIPVAFRAVDQGPSVSSISMPRFIATVASTKSYTSDTDATFSLHSEVTFTRSGRTKSITPTSCKEFTVPSSKRKLEIVFGSLGSNISVSTILFQSRVLEFKRFGGNIGRLQFTYPISALAVFESCIIVAFISNSISIIHFEKEDKIVPLGKVVFV